MVNFLDKLLSSNYQLKTDNYSSHTQIALIIKKLYKPKATIIDLGCDIGFFGKVLCNLHIPKEYIYGLDYNKKNLFKAQKYYKKTILMDLNKNKWSLNKKFNIVVLADTIEHLINPSQALYHSLKILKPKGIIILSIPNSVYWWARLSMLTGNFPQHNKGIFDKTHLHFFTYKTFNDLLDKFENLHKIIYVPTQAPLIMINKRGLRTMIKFLYNLTYLLSKFWPSLFAYQHIFVLEKY